jgi:hypothetical protein
MSGTLAFTLETSTRFIPALYPHLTAWDAAHASPLLMAVFTKYELVERPGDPQRP